MAETKKRVAGWRSPEGRARYVAAYDATLSLWPVPHESRTVPTRFGETHVLVSGPADGPPLVLMHAAGTSATQWFPNAGRLARQHRIHAVDFIGGPGKGAQTHAILSRADCVSWMTDLLDALEVERAGLVGSSHGGWFGLNLALSEPDRVGRIVLLAPAASLLPFRKATVLGLLLGPHLPAFTARLSMRAVFGGRYEVNERFVKQLAMSLKYFRYQQGAVLPGVFDDDALRGLHTPTLVLVGENEMIYKARAALDRATRLIPGVEAELVPDAGHLLGMEKAERVDARILEFLGKGGGPRAER
jgi:pimeloyl-ACP methyl ester carboxylesterase